MNDDSTIAVSRDHTCSLSACAFKACVTSAICVRDTGEIIIQIK